MNPLHLWKLVKGYKFEAEDVVPEDLIPGMAMAVRELLRDCDFDDALDIYESDFFDEYGPAPYRAPEDFEDRWLLHPLTFEAVGSEDHEFHVERLLDPKGRLTVSLYAGIYGYVVRGSDILVINEQGKFGAVSNSVLEVGEKQALQCLWRHAADGQSLGDLVNNPTWWSENGAEFPLLL